MSKRFLICALFLYTSLEALQIPTGHNSAYFDVQIDRVEQIFADEKYTDWTGVKVKKLNKTRCRGQAMKDFYILRYGRFERIPDIVVFPRSHKDVVFCVELANKFGSVIIPYAGGTNTMLSLSHSKDDQRFFISLDVTQMNRILWIDRKSMLACMEAGIVGRDMEEALEKEGLTVGHEPDSIELSTLGGWVATRSSGMKQQTYGNIEDIVEKITLVTSIGVLEKDFLAPRVSIGPDFHQIILGSEGTLGVITKVVVKVHKKPDVRRFGSIVFPDFEHGVKFMHEVSKWPTKPSSLRLVDNCHIQIGMTFENHPSYLSGLISAVKQYFLLNVYRFDIKKISLVTYLIENNKEEADRLEDKFKFSAKKFDGILAGPEYGKKTYLMTLVVCYTRDFFFDLGFLFDSLETSVTWDKLWSLVTTLEGAWKQELKMRKLKNAIAIRISQIYHSGACVYVYFGIGPTENQNQFEVFNDLNKMLKGLMIKAGGTLSHHHGVGKKNMEFYPQVVSKVGVELFKAIKEKVDPINVFGAGNMIKCKL
ncbi:unnamed protein product [Chironomus riparius]|uniref:Alkylglycerone-phosphate synthase n=1 Tax=Chironomus riparius TaxID=315576 RepID=A0A9N9SAT2_9DIPT|nr:unnamed protein product [Chironomus riparius]